MFKIINGSYICGPNDILYIHDITYKPSTEYIRGFLIKYEANYECKYYSYKHEKIKISHKELSNIDYDYRFFSQIIIHNNNDTYKFTAIKVFLPRAYILPYYTEEYYINNLSLILFCLKYQNVLLPKSLYSKILCNCAVIK